MVIMKTIMRTIISTTKHKKRVLEALALHTSFKKRPLPKDFLLKMVI